MFWFVFGVLLLFVAGIATVFPLDKDSQKMSLSDKIFKFFTNIAIFFCVVLITLTAGLFITGPYFKNCFCYP